MDPGSLLLTSGICFFLRFLRNVLSGFATRLIEVMDKQRIAQGQR